ncbi:MAG: RDD family protein, partial [Bacteroidetes bacterium]|nr:RDD family protein [Bacteroidota bacterium]
QCPRCSAPLPPGSRFCQSCGASLQPAYPAAIATAAPAGHVPNTYPQKPYGPRPYNAVRLPGRYPKAPLEARFWASVLDGLIGIGLSLPAIICFYLAIQKSKRSYSYYDDDSYDPGGVFVLIVLALLLYLLPLVYRFIRDGLGQGQSWGKKNMYLMVVDLGSNQPCGIGKSIARNLITALVCIIPFIGWLTECIMVLATDDGRKIGDLAANTQVVHIDEYYRDSNTI